MLARNSADSVAVLTEKDDAGGDEEHEDVMVAQERY